MLALKKAPVAAPPTVAKSILDTFARAGIDTLFTVMGGPLMPFLQSCKSERFARVVVCRHESAAAIMAAAYFHELGVPAALALTSGPGAVNAANGVVHAQREASALFVISARPAAANAGRGAVQDFDTARFFGTITKQSEALLVPEQLPFLAEELVARAVAPTPGPVNLTVSADQWLRCVGGKP